MTTEPDDEDVAGRRYKEGFDRGLRLEVARGAAHLEVDSRRPGVVCNGGGDGFCGGWSTTNMAWLLRCIAKRGGMLVTQLIACTGHGEIVQWLGRECSLVVIMEFPQSCSKLWPHMTYGYGMHFWGRWIK